MTRYAYLLLQNVCLFQALPMVHCAITLAYSILCIATQPGCVMLEQRSLLRHARSTQPYEIPSNQNGVADSFQSSNQPLLVAVYGPWKSLTRKALLMWRLGCEKTESWLLQRISLRLEMIS